MTLKSFLARALFLAIVMVPDGPRMAQAQTARIVGLGATTCDQFTTDVQINPRVQRDYLAWAQGYMSGILLGRPPDVDEKLDLNPTSFSLSQQLHFLNDRCARNPELTFSEAVEGLYKRLRKEGGI
jgi:hypothetical protein